MSDKKNGGEVAPARPEDLKSALFGGQSEHAAYIWKGVGNVRIVAMKVGERDAFDKETRRRRKTKGKTPVNVLQRMLIACVHTEAGEPMFTSNDEDKITDLPANKVEGIFKVCCKMCGYGDDELDEDDSGN